MRFQNLRMIEIKETSEISWPKQLVLEVEKHAPSLRYVSLALEIQV